MKKILWHNIFEHDYGAPLDQWQMPKKLLKLSEKSATWVNCPKKTAGCFMDVVPHDDEDIVGVCNQEPFGCQNKQLKSEDLQLWEFNDRELLERIAGNLTTNEHGMYNKKMERIEGFKNLWRLGKYIWNNKYEYPVFILISDCKEQLLNAVNYISTSFQKKFIIFIPSQETISATVETFCNQEKNLCFSLQSTFLEHKDYVIHLSSETKRNIIDWIKSFHFDNQREYFPRVPNLKWEDIHIQLIDQFEVSITAKGKSYGVKTCTKMGGAKKKSKNNQDPDMKMEWKFFLIFLDEYHRNRWRFHSSNGKKRRDRKNTLQDFLKEYFGKENPNLLNTEAISSCHEEKQYSAKFTVKQSNQYFGFKQSLGVVS